MKLQVGVDFHGLAIQYVGPVMLFQCGLLASFEEVPITFYSPCTRNISGLRDQDCQTDFRVELAPPQIPDIWQYFTICHA